VCDCRGRPSANAAQRSSYRARGRRIKPTEIRGHQAAGALFLASALISYFVFGDIVFVQVAIGISLLVVQESSKRDLLRFVVFGWVLLAVGIVVVAALSQGEYLAVIPTLLFAGGIVGLMLERLSQSQVLVYSSVAVAGIALSLLV